jgi:hypothetical protein
MRAKSKGVNYDIKERVNETYRLELGLNGVVSPLAVVLPGGGSPSESDSASLMIPLKLNIIHDWRS